MSPLQKRLLLLLALMLALQSGINLVDYLGEVREGRFGGDFISFWTAGQHLRAGGIGAIYDAERWQAVLARGGTQELGWFVYPPIALFVVWPFGGLGYDQAVLWWSIVPASLYLVLLWLLTKRSRSHGSPAQAFALASCLCLPFLMVNLFTGQTGTLVAVFALLAAWAWPSRPLLLGIAIGLIAIKPQMGLLLPFALAAAGQWRAFAAAAATIVALALGVTLWLGLGIWADYLAMTKLFGQFVGGGHEGVRDLAVGPFVSLQAIGLPAALAGAAQVAITLAVVGVIVRVFADERAACSGSPSDLRLGLLATGALLATPYALSYDTPVLVLAILPLLARAWRDGLNGLELAAITSLVILPFAPSFLIENHVPFALGALLLAFAALYRRHATEARIGNGPVPCPLDGVQPA